jgi:hypothetical protein
MLIFLIASISWADEYNSRQAGQPWKLIAYVLNPLGVTLDYLVARPLHRFLHHETIDKLTGHSQFTEEKEYREAKY